VSRSGNGPIPNNSLPHAPNQSPLVLRTGGVARTDVGGVRLLDGLSDATEGQ